MIRVLLAAVCVALFVSDAAARERRFLFRHRTETVSTSAGTYYAETTTVRATGPVGDALAEVNAARAVRGLRPFLPDPGLTVAAQAAAAFRAAHRIAGHTANDFSFLPPGSSAAAAGCGALDPSWGWGTCCTYERHTYAGAAVVTGSDGRRFMHIFVR